MTIEPPQPQEVLSAILNCIGIGAVEELLVTRDKVIPNSLRD